MGLWVFCKFTDSRCNKDWFFIESWIQILKIIVEDQYGRETSKINRILEKKQGKKKKKKEKRKKAYLGVRWKRDTERQGELSIRGCTSIPKPDFFSSIITAHI